MWLKSFAMRWGCTGRRLWMNMQSFWSHTEVTRMWLVIVKTYTANVFDVQQYPVDMHVITEVCVCRPECASTEQARVHPGHCNRGGASGHQLQSVVQESHMESGSQTWQWTLCHHALQSGRDLLHELKDDSCPASATAATADLQRLMFLLCSLFYIVNHSVKGVARLSEGLAERGSSGKTQWAASAADRQTGCPAAPCQGHHLPAHPVNTLRQTHEAFHYNKPLCDKS